MHGHSFEWIWTKFGTCYSYTLRMFMGRLVSAARAFRLAPQARAPFAVYILHCKWVANSIGEFATIGWQLQWIECRRREE